MRDLIVKLESLKDSKEWESIVDGLRKGVEKRNQELLKGLVHDDDEVIYPEGDVIRHEIGYIDELIKAIKVKDKDCKEALIADLEKSKTWRINRVLGKTHEYQLDAMIGDSYYTAEDFIRAENWWIECFENLPNKLIEELKVKDTQVKEMEDSEVQEQIDALASLENNGGL